MKERKETLISALYEFILKRPYGTEIIVDVELSRIKVPVSFKKHPPKSWKMENVREFYNIHGFVDSPITVYYDVFGEYVLMDGYTRYLVLMENGVKKIPIKFVN